MAKQNSVFRGFTEEDVKRAESSTFTIQVGPDFHTHNRSYVFTEKSAIVHYNKIINELLDMLEGGDKKEKKQAEFLLQNIFIRPLRIH